MGASAAKPYIFDEFDSDEDYATCESALETPGELDLHNIEKPAISQQLESHPTTEAAHNDLPIDSPAKSSPGSQLGSISYTTVKALTELLSLLENHDYDGAQKAALKLKTGHHNALPIPSSTDQTDNNESESEKSTTTSIATSSWKTHAEAIDAENCSTDHPESGDLSEEQKQALAMLDEDLAQFEMNESKISSDLPVFQSGIPRLKSSMLRSGGNAAIHIDVSRKPQHERKRSPSPQSPGRSKGSGIPRYAWANVTPEASSTHSAVSPTSHFVVPTTKSPKRDTYCVCSKQTINSLTETSDKTHSLAHKKTLDRLFSAERSTCSTASSESSHGTELTSPDELITGDSPTTDISISDLTGRARINKKRSALPQMWTKSDHLQKGVKTPNESETSMYSKSPEKPTDEAIVSRASEDIWSFSERKVLDLKRWFCISRPQYKSSCGISSVVSCWNYLFSTLGQGSLEPLTQETAMKLIGFSSPFDGINFGPVTGNQTLFRWFHELNDHFGVKGRCYIMYKPSGRSQTLDVTEEMAQEALKQGLRDPNTAFIYHCHNHYFCPIGYEATPQFCVDAYKNDVVETADLWVLIGDTSRKHQTIHCKNWEDIRTDLDCKSPSYFNVRQSWKGVMQQENVKKVGVNLHCIMAFQRLTSNMPLPPKMVTSRTSPSHSSRSSAVPHDLLSSSPLPESPMADPHQALETVRPELGNEFDPTLEDEEVGCENLDSDRSDDEIDEDVGASVNESETNPTMTVLEEDKGK